MYSRGPKVETLEAPVHTDIGPRVLGVLGIPCTVVTRVEALLEQSQMSTKSALPFLPYSDYSDVGKFSKELIAP